MAEKTFDKIRLDLVSVAKGLDCVCDASDCNECPFRHEGSERNECIRDKLTVDLDLLFDNINDVMGSLRDCLSHFDSGDGI